MLNSSKRWDPPERLPEPENFPAEYAYHRETRGRGDKPLEYTQMPYGWNGLVVISHPRFALQAAQVAKADVVGDGHVRCFLTDTTGARLAAIAFKTADTPFGEALRQSNGRPLHVTGKLRSNNWQGRKQTQFALDDAAFA